MIALPELQSRLAGALLGQQPWPCEWIVADCVSPEVRLAVHRNNMFVSLTNALRSTFPIVCRVVDEQFFFYVAEEFIKNRPPRQACLASYGDEFAAFLRRFPDCSGLPYLPDLARLEWLLHRAGHSDSPSPLAASALVGLAAKELSTLKLSFAPSFGFLRSPWPIDRIWRSNKCVVNDEPIALTSGGVSLEVRRLDDTVIFQNLPSAVFAFRLSLHSGCTLETATAMASVVDARFDLATALLEVFREQALVGFEAADNGLEA
jgi:hypothetical protein